MTWWFWCKTNASQKFHFTLLLLFILFPLWILEVYLPHLCPWAVLAEILLSHCLFPAQRFTWAQLPFYLRSLQCPSPKIDQRAMFEMSCNKRLAKILPISKTDENRWIYWVICSWLSIPLCQNWVKTQGTQIQCYPSIQLLMPCRFSFQGDPWMCDTYFHLKTLEQGERGIKLEQSYKIQKKKNDKNNTQCLWTAGLTKKIWKLTINVTRRGEVIFPCRKDIGENINWK